MGLRPLPAALANPAQLALAALGAIGAAATAAPGQPAAVAIGGWLVVTAALGLAVAIEARRPAP